MCCVSWLFSVMLGREIIASGIRERVGDSIKTLRSRSYGCRPCSLPLFPASIVELSELPVTPDAVASTLRSNPMPTSDPEKRLPMWSIYSFHQFRQALLHIWFVYFGVAVRVEAPVLSHIHISVWFLGIICLGMAPLWGRGSGLGILSILCFDHSLCWL